MSASDKRPKGAPKSGRNSAARARRSRGVEQPAPPSTQPQREQWIERQLKELALRCPYTRNNPSECPLCGLRKLDPSAIAAWLDGLEQPEKEYLMLYHQCCFVIRWENEHVRRPPTGPKT